ncbi:ABC transporter permease [bacterium]|nr:ABC transporter permease [bacterium]
MRNVYHLALKEFLHLWRDRRTLVFLLLMPSIMTVLFGYAIGNPKVTALPTRVLDRDGGRIGSEYVEAIGGSLTFRPEVVEDATEDDVARAEEDLRTNRLAAFVVLPEGLTRDADEGRPAKVRVVVDASDTFAAPAILRELASTTVQQNSFLAANLRVRDGKARTTEDGLHQVAPVELAHELRFNPDLKTQNFVMPGVIGLILQLLTVIVMSTSIARERERGTMDQLAVTPLTPAEIFVGKLLPYFLISLVVTVNVMVLAWWLFGVSLSGHLPVVAALVVSFILGSLGVGQVISIVSRNQSQAVQLAVFFILPAFVLSGAFTPIETQPEAVRPIAYLFPLTYFCRGFRAALLRQATMADLRVDLAAMALFVLVAFGASVLLLRSRRD